MTDTTASPVPHATPAPNPAQEARGLVRQALKGALGTLSQDAGDPYVSLVTIAASMSGAPLMLISKLAWHTQNLMANPRASLLFDGTDGTGDPLAGGRVTVMGRAVPSHSPDVRRRFLTRQPAAKMYADFPDFAFYELHIERAHFIGGFGRIVDLRPADLLLDVSDAGPLMESEADVVSHMNEDHSDALALYAAHVANAQPGTKPETKPGTKPGKWQMSGLDPDGFDLVCDGTAARINFAARVGSPNAARLEFVRMAAAARALANEARARAAQL